MSNQIKLGCFRSLNHIFTQLRKSGGSEEKKKTNLEEMRGEKTQNPLIGKTFKIREQFDIF